MSNQKLMIGAGVAAVIVIFIIIIMASTAESGETSTSVPQPKAPVTNNREESENTASKFFDSGMGFLKGKNRQGIEDAYVNFMHANSGSGVLRLNKNQISAEINRMTDDRGAYFLKEIAGRDKVVYRIGAERPKGAMDEGLVKNANLQPANGNAFK